MRFLVLRFDAPWMSFGGAAVDAEGVTDDHPGRSLLTGLLGNALGWDHREHEALGRLQARLVVASRADRPGTRTVDYQTTELGQPHLASPGWTTRGAPEWRQGARETALGTDIRRRHYLEDARYTVVVALIGDGEPSLDDLHVALVHPARPLFLGRKSCLPAAPLVTPGAAFVEAASPEAALRAIPLLEPADEVALWVPADDPESPGAVRHWDLRDWRSQLHTGSGVVRRVLLRGAELPPGSA